uniref:Uncharacterized protein n=1 Tax=Strigamia maritima TaxID=126957 RepID=T1IU22_STRMM
MSTKTYLTFICLLSSVFLYLVDGLKCYQCNSNSHTHCTEFLDKENSNIQPTDCQVHEAKYCVKTTGMYKGEVGTQRFCASVGWGDICEFVQRKGDYREYRSCVYTCSGKECNSSPRKTNF